MFQQIRALWLIGTSGKLGRSNILSGKLEYSEKLTFWLIATTWDLEMLQQTRAVSLTGMFWRSPIDYDDLETVKQTKAVWLTAMTRKLRWQSKLEQLG